MAARFLPHRLDNVEDVEAYRTGGLHPISIGDCFAQDRALFVKEQRVDGSYLLNIQRFNKLRCTLRGFERIILFGIPSIQILSKQLYSTTNDSKNLQQKLSKDRDSFSLNP